MKDLSLTSCKDSLHLRLYIASGTPNSDAAQANLRRVLDANDEHAIELEIVDVMEQSGQAFSDGVLVTPTLIKTLGRERRILVGRLEPVELVETFLFRS